MLVQWKPNEIGHNFGDYLSILFERVFEAETWKKIIDDPAIDYYLVGSVLDDYYLRRSRKSGRHATFFGCGFRGNILSQSLLSSACIAGVRGPATRDAVVEAGKTAEVIGDPALLLSLILPRPKKNNLTIIMPHINDPRKGTYKPSDYACDLLASPVVADPTELVQRIGQIAGAKFVLAGAMHSAIVAYAFGRPFSFFDGKHRDCPAKWRDWALSVGLTDADVVFHQTADEGKQWYNEIKGRLAPVLHGPLVAAAQSIGPIREPILKKMAAPRWLRWLSGLRPQL